MKVSEVRLFVRLVEDRYGLPRGILALKNGTGRPLKSFEEWSLSEIRTAIVGRILTERSISYVDLARGMGLNHASVYRFEEQAKNKTATADDKYFYYFEVIATVPML